MRDTSIIFTFLLWCVLVAFASMQSSCATMTKNARNAHYYCVLDLTNTGVNALDSNTVCKSIFRENHK